MDHLEAQRHDLARIRHMLDVMGDSRRAGGWTKAETIRYEETCVIEIGLLNSVACLD